MFSVTFNIKLVIEHSTMMNEMKTEIKLLSGYGVKKV